MVIWRSVGVQALAEALSLWAHTHARKGSRPAAPTAELPAATSGDDDRNNRGVEPRVVYNADRRS